MNLEYKSQRFDYGLVSVFDRRMFDERLTSFLNEQAALGWEFKGCFHDYGYHAHLIFCREVSREQEEGK